jgi:hypothetical protein
MHIIYLYESREKSLFLHFDSQSDRMSFDTSENVCRDLQNSRSFIYFFYRQHHVFDITMTDNFQYQSQGPGGLMS